MNIWTATFDPDNSLDHISNQLLRRDKMRRVICIWKRSFHKTHSATKLKAVITTELDQCNQEELGRNTENICSGTLHLSVELSSCMMTRERAATHLSALYTILNLKIYKKICVVLCTVIFKIWNIRYKLDSYLIIYYFFW